MFVGVVPPLSSSRNICAEVYEHHGDHDDDEVQLLCEHCESHITLGSVRGEYRRVPPALRRCPLSASRTPLCFWRFVKLRPKPKGCLSASCARQYHSIIHQPRGKFAGHRARRRESRWQETSRMAAFGSLLRALRLRALLALSHTGLNHHAFAGCRVSVGVQQRVAVCKVFCRSLCNVVQCEVAVVCVVSVVYGR